MAKEYIERDAALMGVMRAGCLANTVQVLKDIPAADVIEVFRGEDSVLAEFENDYKDFKKIKTHLAQIIVEGKVEKPCYSILWFDEESKEYNIGYSSYCLDYVRKWLELVFDVVDAPAADVVGVVRCKDCINYCPDNCTWATPKEQANNRRTTLMLEHNGITLSLADWARRLGINRHTLWSRIKKQGWSVDKALSEGVSNS